MELRSLLGLKKRSTGPTGEKVPEKHEGLPSSALPHGLCPRCNKQSSFETVGAAPITFDPDLHIVDRAQGASPIPLDQVAILSCRNCGQSVIVVEEQCTNGISWRDQSEGRRGGSLTWRAFHWWPNASANISTDVPAQIAEVFREAIAAAQAQCPRAAAVMARRTLEAITVDKGETSGGLAKRLEQLAIKGMLQSALAEWAKEIRLVGNLGAHFDPIDTVSNNDAHQLNNFIRELLRYLYELPAELDRRRRG